MADPVSFGIAFSPGTYSRNFARKNLHPTAGRNILNNSKKKIRRTKKPEKN